jgi:hypothetical protein
MHDEQHPVLQVIHSRSPSPRILARSSPIIGTYVVQAGNGEALIQDCTSSG